MESIGLFCAASDRLEASYYDLAGAFGRLVGERGLTLVYGGADSGLMESAARGVKNAGGHVVGIVPSVLETRRRVSRYVDEVVPCHDLSDRKAIMGSVATCW
jgi:Predicted Rossmann fold nucleotide-binding protein